MKKSIILGASGLLLLTGSFIGGWVAKEHFPLQPYRPLPLRLSGFNFVKPLLVCDIKPEIKYSEIKTLDTQLANFIDKQKEEGNIEAVSVYFQDLQSNGRIDINQDEKFRSASLGKVPIMIAFLRFAEDNPGILDKKITYHQATDYNEPQEIKPKDPLVSGKTYTVRELIEKMIIYSDNNAIYELVKLIDSDTLGKLYQDLGVPLLTPDVSSKSIDFITTKDISYFFRILYNGTYLDNELSDEALEILSRVDYANGIVASIPQGISVSHKFGLYTVKNNGIATQRELHDCGIIYHPKDPYLLYIMTKSSADIPNIEKTITGISKIVYQQVDSYSK
jgi:beta-lactamase class A